MKKVLLLLADGFETFEASVFIDVIGWNLVEGDKSTELFTCGLKKEIKFPNKPGGKFSDSQWFSYNRIIGQHRKNEIRTNAYNIDWQYINLQSYSGTRSHFRLSEKSMQTIFSGTSFPRKEF